MPGHWQDHGRQQSGDSSGEEVFRLSDSFWGSMKLQNAEHHSPRWHQIQPDEHHESYDSPSSGRPGHSYGTGTSDSEPDSPYHASRPTYTRQTSLNTLASRRADKRRQDSQSHDKTQPNRFDKFTRPPEIPRRQSQAVIEQPLISAATTQFTEIDPAPLSGISQNFVDISKFIPPAPPRRPASQQARRVARPSVNLKQTSYREDPSFADANESTLQVLESWDMELTIPPRRNGPQVTCEASRPFRQPSDPRIPAQISKHALYVAGKGGSDGDIEESSITDFELETDSKDNDSEDSRMIAIQASQEVLQSDVAIIIPDEGSCDEGIYERGVTVQIIDEPPVVIPIQEINRRSSVTKSGSRRASISRPQAPQQTFTGFPQVDEIRAMQNMQSLGRIDVIVESECESEREDRRRRARHPKQIRIMSWLDGLE